MVSNMKKSGRGTHKAVSVVSLIGFMLCTLLLLYPLISDRWNKYRDSKIIDAYIDEVNSGDADIYENELEKAREYNETIYSEGTNIVTDAENNTDEYYESILNSTGTGIMGYIEIPKIGVTEPIFHYSDNYSLDHGIGHIHGSSIPIGGANTHSILTGHRGLPSQKLFSDLDRMTYGDKFYIHTLGHTYAYSVCSIKVVLPNNVSDLMIEENRDLITLVTCEPYGVNTHRLLITGERVDFDETLVENGLVTTEEHKQIIDPAFMIFIGFIIFIIGFVITVSVKRALEKKKALIPAADPALLENSDNSIVKNETKPLNQDSENYDLPPRELTEANNTEINKPVDRFKTLNRQKDNRVKKIGKEPGIRSELISNTVKAVDEDYNRQNHITNITNKLMSALALTKSKITKGNKTSKKANRTEKDHNYNSLFDSVKSRKISQQAGNNRLNGTKRSFFARKKNIKDVNNNTNYTDNETVLVKKVVVVEEKRKNRSALFYVTLGISIGCAVAGGIVFVYKFIKKRKGQNKQNSPIKQADNDDARKK